MFKRLAVFLAGLLLLSACTFDALPNPLRPQAGNQAAQNTALEPTRTPAPAATPLPSAPATAAPVATATTQTTQSTITRPTKYESCSDVKPALGMRLPELPDSTGQIVYLTLDGNLALSDITGRLRINLTTDAFFSDDRQAGTIYQFPVFSPDAKQVAFVGLGTTADFNGITQTVHVAPATGGPVTSLYRTADWGIPYLDFSPDGSQVAFLTINQRDGAVRVVNSAGGEASILENGSPMYWHWRNDSAALLAHFNGRAEREGDAGISIIDVRGATTATHHILAAMPGAFQSPHFSPDGRHMLYVENAAGNDELVLAGADGKPICAIMPIQTNAYFAWSPDGGKVAVMDTQTPLQLPAPVVIHDFAKGARRQMQEDISAFFWSPDGTRLATYRLVSNAGQTAVRNNAGKLNAPAQQDQRAALRIEVIDVASGQAARVADTLPTQQFGQYLQYFDQYSRSVTPWSPDGQHLVFTTYPPAGSPADVTVASFNAGQASPSLKRIAAGVVAFWSPR